MSLLSIRRDPSESELKWFGLVIALLGAVVGTIAWLKFGATLQTGIVIACVGAGIGVIYTVAVPWRRPIHLAWQFLVFPIGWTISTLILIVTYYVVVTPIGLILRVLGKGGIQRGPKPDAETYWIERGPPAKTKRYFHQY